MFFIHKRHDLLNCRNTASLTITITVNLFLNLLLLFLFVLLPLMPLDVAFLMAVMAHKISILALGFASTSFSLSRTSTLASPP
jgi:hypothetical protein